jgi:hypothetical protein
MRDKPDCNGAEQKFSWIVPHSVFPPFLHSSFCSCCSIPIDHSTCSTLALDEGHQKASWNSRVGNKPSGSGYFYSFSDRFHLSNIGNYTYKEHFTWNALCSYNLCHKPEKHMYIHCTTTEMGTQKEDKYFNNKQSCWIFVCIILLHSLFPGIHLRVSEVQVNGVTYHGISWFVTVSFVREVSSLRS